MPELVYITGTDDDTENNRKNKNKKTKINPSRKMSIINNGLTKLINSENHKTIKKNGEILELKSPKELKEEWGINLGSNLTFPGRIISQPHLYFSKNGQKLINPNNGTFIADNPTDAAIITNQNIFFVYDKKESYAHKKIFNDIIKNVNLKNLHFQKILIQIKLEDTV